MVDGFIGALPRLILAVVILGLFVVIARVGSALVARAAARKRERGTLQLALARLTQTAVIVLGVLVATTAAFPAFSPADLVSLLGIGSVAIGFAFKDIFQNFLAGLLILITKPFRVGDQIAFKEFAGTVEDIQTRATLLKTFDSRRVVVPNSELYTNVVVVETAFKTRRMQYDFGIGYADDIDRAKVVILEVLKAAEGVLPDPTADVIVVALAESSVTLRARWWNDSGRADSLIAQDGILSEVKRRFCEEGIDLPYPTRELFVNDRAPRGKGAGPRDDERPGAAVEAGEGRRSANGREQGARPLDRPSP
jgi:small-conductance mechanosensitive channel